MAEVKCWGVCTGSVSLIHKASREASKYLAEQDGFVGVHILPDGRMIWLYDTENNAKRALNNAESKGIRCGKGVADLFVDEQYLKGAEE